MLNNGNRLQRLYINDVCTSFKGKEIVKKLPTDSVP